MDRTITINSDLGESIGIHSFGNDDELISIVDTVNVACGMHAGDPGSMEQVVRSAAAAGITIGAHPGLPDIAGFGRRAMMLDEEDVRDLVRYQVGALVAFLEAHHLALDHIKPHGALFAMTAKDDKLMRSICNVARQYQVPVFGIAGTSHERIASAEGVDFVSEFYVDLEYDDEGMVIVERRPAASDLDIVTRRARDAIRNGTLTTRSGATRSAVFDSICVHSDLPQAAAVARVVRSELTAVRL